MTFVRQVTDNCHGKNSWFSDTGNTGGACQRKFSASAVRKWDRHKRHEWAHLALWTWKYRRSVVLRISGKGGNQRRRQIQDCRCTGCIWNNSVRPEKMQPGISEKSTDLYGDCQYHNSRHRAQRLYIAGQWYADRGNVDTVSGNGLELPEKNGVLAWASVSAGHQLLLSPFLSWSVGRWEKGTGRNSLLWYVFWRTLLCSQWKMPC